jgi:vacuolar-type H+-ATPase subunit E/Vma4
MGMKEIEERIRESGRKEVEGIMKEAEKEAENRRKEFEEEARKRGEGIIREAEIDAELVKRRILADSKLKVKEMADDRRNEIIEEVLERTRKRVMDLDSREKRSILAKLAEEGKKQIEDPVVFVDKKYVRLLSGAKPLAINDFGVIVRSRKGKSEVNNTLSKKMGQLNELLRHRIAEVLFA